MSVLKKLQGGLVVSCQPVTGGPMDSVEIVVAMAKAAAQSGASALRIEGVANVAAVKCQVDIPVIGIVKKIDSQTPVVITPKLKDIDELIQAQADIVAIDATDRVRPTPVKTLISHLVAANVPAMADCATRQDGEQALAVGCCVLGTTLSGYTAETMQSGDEPDFALIRSFAELVNGTRALVMAEGRFNTPMLAAEALINGADCVTVGSAITRIEHIVGWFSDAVQSVNA